MKRNRGFTLVELLVVIGIIAVLISMLMPALSKVREQANSVACQSNMKQFGMAFATYLAENKQYPTFRWPQALNSHVRGTLLSDASSQFPNSVADAFTNDDPLKARPLKLLHCPNVPERGGSNGMIPITLTYTMTGLSVAKSIVDGAGWKPMIIGGNYDPTGSYKGVKPGQIRRSAEFAIMTEAWNTTSPAQTAWTTTSWRLFVSNEFSALFVHGNGTRNVTSNVLFADFHVAPIRYAPTVNPSKWSIEPKTGYRRLNDGDDAMFNYDAAKSRLQALNKAEKAPAYLN